MQKHLIFHLVLGIFVKIRSNKTARAEIRLEKTTGRQIRKEFFHKVRPPPKDAELQDFFCGILRS